MAKLGWGPLLTIVLTITALGCGPGGDPGAGDRNEPAREITQQSFSEFGDFVVHFNAQPTDMLPPKVARAYGIQRSENRAMLNVSVLRKEEGTIGQPVSAEVTVAARNLTGQLKNVEIRKIEDAGAIYYIGEIGVANRETLIFEISVQPEGAPDAHIVRFRQQFYTS